MNRDGVRAEGMIGVAGTHSSAWITTCGTSVAVRYFQAFARGGPEEGGGGGLCRSSGG